MNVKSLITVCIILIFVISYIHIKHVETKEIKVEPLIIETKEDVKEPKENIELVSTEKEVVNNSPELISLGEFKLTAYCSCSICCGKWAYNRPNGIVYGAIGEPLKEGYSIAVDPSVIPYRTEVVINGNTYKAQDCGGAIKGNRIDVYMDSHQKALEFGVQYAEVFIRKEK